MAAVMHCAIIQGRGQGSHGHSMGIVEKTRAAAPTTTADFDRFRLRRFVEGLANELETVDAATDLADVARILEGNAKAVLFRAVGPERQALVGNVAGRRPRSARGVGRATGAV